MFQSPPWPNIPRLFRTSTPIHQATMSFSPADSSEPSPDACGRSETRKPTVDKKMLGKKAGKIHGHFRILNWRYRFHICLAYFLGLCKGYPHKIWPYMVQYLHFRILKFPLKKRVRQKKNYNYNYDYNSICWIKFNPDWYHVSVPLYTQNCEGNLQHFVQIPLDYRWASNHLLSWC